VNANQGSSRCQFLSLWLDPTGDSKTRCCVHKNVHVQTYPLGISKRGVVYIKNMYYQSLIFQKVLFFIVYGVKYKTDCKLLEINVFLLHISSFIKYQNPIISWKCRNSGNWSL